MRRDDEEFNPYSEEGHHHDHHHGHHGFHDQEGGSYGGSGSLEHRAPPPPPPSRPDYGEQRSSGPYEEQGYDHRNPYGPPAGPYPPGPHSSSGHSYGGAEYQASPYSQPAPVPHHGEGRAPPHIRQAPGIPVRLHTKADPNYSLAVVPGHGPVMKHTDPSDDYQVWYKDESMSTRVKDETGASSFSLINKATGEALRHASEDLKQCLLAEYDPSGRDASVWWTMSEDMGHGYHCVRMTTNISRNFDVLHGDKKSGGVKDGSPLITFAWKKQDNQIWKMTPACTFFLPSLRSSLSLFMINP